jgi:PRTRC genetic system protein A
MWINHSVLYAGTNPQPVDGFLYEYIMAANGIFLHAKRENLEVMFPFLGGGQNLINGLEPLTPYVNLPSPIPTGYLWALIKKSREALPNEALFYLRFENGLWKGHIPNQVRSRAAVHPVDPFNQACVDSLIEVHSHNTMDAIFSSTDNRDETGFKLFAVLGHVDRSPVNITVRVGVYGHFYEIPYDLVFEKCSGVENATEN